MKTAMQELIERLKRYRDCEIEKHIGASGLNFAINTAIELDAKYASQGVEAVELSQLLFDCNQVLTGYAMDDSWSEWDESVRQRVIKMQYDINQPSSRHQENGDFYCADWNRCGSICDEQCPACKKAENAPEILPDSPASPVDGREAVR